MKTRQRRKKVQMGPFPQPADNPQAAQKGPDARRRPRAAREAYSLDVERAAEGANEADGPFSAAGYRARPRIDAGGPGSGNRLPVSVTSVPSTRRIDTSREVKLPT